MNNESEIKMMSIIKCSHLSKRYGNIIAIDDLSITIEQGSMVGLLGPSGAGKTTLLSLLMGIRQPTTGTIRVLGGDPRKRSVRERLGVTPQETSLPQALTVSETIKLVSAHFKKSTDPGELIEAFNLSALLNRRCCTLSGGQRRRVAVALAFAGNPSLVLLDEPTTGLDPKSRRTMWGLIRDRHAAGTSIVITSHYLEEVEELAERVVVLDNGHILADDTVSVLIGSFATKSVSLVTEDIALCYSFSSAVGKPKIREGNVVSIQTNNSDDLIREIVRSAISFSDLWIEKATLDEAFLAIMNRSESEKEDFHA